jgi:hypothetical protein
MRPSQNVQAVANAVTHSKKAPSEEGAFPRSARYAQTATAEMLMSPAAGLVLTADTVHDSESQSGLFIVTFAFSDAWKPPPVSFIPEGHVAVAVAFI